MYRVIEEILRFWFGEAGSNPAAVPARMGRWFGVDAGFDAEIGQRFGKLCRKAAAGQLAAWEETPHGRLGLILLLDQFSRNIHRGTPRAFADDPEALRLCLVGLERDDDAALSTIERGFFYLPLQHAEQPLRQAESVRRYRQLWDEADSDWRPPIQGMLDYAILHRDIIERFGRFPHRNAILGRESTPEEQAFLTDGAASFGQHKR